MGLFEKVLKGASKSIASPVAIGGKSFGAGITDLLHKGREFSAQCIAKSTVLENFLSKIAEEVGVRVSVEDLLGSSSLQEDFISQLKGIKDESSRYGGILNEKNDALAKASSVENSLRKANKEKNKFKGQLDGALQSKHAIEQELAAYKQLEKTFNDGFVSRGMEPLPFDKIAETIAVLNEENCRLKGEVADCAASAGGHDHHGDEL